MTEKSFAKYELQTALLDGLFESTWKIKDAHLQLREIERWFEDGDIYLKLYVPISLGVQAESILLTILKLTGLQGAIIEPMQSDLFLEPKDDAKLKNAGYAITTEYALLKEAGLDIGKKGYTQLRTYLEQMSMVRVFYQNKRTGWRGADWFLRYRAHDNGRLIVQLNWRLTGAIFGEYLHAEINMTERNTLKKDAAKTLHRWLSAHLWAGKSEFITYEALIGHVWSKPGLPGAIRERKRALKNEILSNFRSLSYWDIEIGERGATITHRKEPKK